MKRWHVDDKLWIKLEHLADEAKMDWFYIDLIARRTITAEELSDLSCALTDATVEAYILKYGKEDFYEVYDFFVKTIGLRLFEHLQIERGIINATCGGKNGQQN